MRPLAPPYLQAGRSAGDQTDDEQFKCCALDAKVESGNDGMDLGGDRQILEMERVRRWEESGSRWMTNEAIDVSRQASLVGGILLGGGRVFPFSAPRTSRGSIRCASTRWFGQPGEQQHKQHWQQQTHNN